MVGVQNFKVPNREAVEPHAVARPQAPDALQVGQFFVVCGFEVVQNGARRDRGVRRVVQAKPAASPAKSDASGSSDDSSTDDEGPRDLLTGDR